MLTTYTYDTTNQLSSFAYPNGVTHAYVYDQRDRPTNLAVNGPGGVLANYAQTFSDSSHKQSVSEATAAPELYLRPNLPADEPKHRGRSWVGQRIARLFA